MDSTTIAMLRMEAMGKKWLPATETPWCGSATGLEHGQVGAWTVETEWQSSPLPGAAKPVL